VKNVLVTVLIVLLVGAVENIVFAADDNNDVIERVHSQRFEDRNENKDNPFPTENDPSRFTDLVIGELPNDLSPANQGALEGGNTGTIVDAQNSNILQAENQRVDGVFNIPTNGPPSPMYGAVGFTQKMLRFEEFGTEKLKFKENEPKHWKPLPKPLDAQSTPNGAELDEFLAGRIWPNPAKYANDKSENPWKEQIEYFMGRELNTPPAEGRPPGLGWSHQRWDEFKPKRYFQSATSGSRINGGLRDTKQTHKYKEGEFGPGGLYYNTTGLPGFEGTTKGIKIKFHPNMPEQKSTALWTFDGTLPPKLLKVNYGETVLFRHYNALPIDVAANRGFGVHTLTTHEHNGHTPAESDGYTNAFFFPGQYYDYRWPIALAGYDSINSEADDPRAGAPDGKGGIKKIPGDWHETMSTHWFHDHMLDFTAQNVYKGSAAMMNYYSAIDRGNESIDDGINLRFPSGSALDSGNRDYDVNLLLADKAWDSDGQLWFNPFNSKGFIGDVMTVNWVYDPNFDVRARKYRFRLLNGSVSRFFKIALVDQNGNRVPFYMIANDGNIMEHTVYFENGELPTQGIAERYDIIIDFSKYKEGDKLYMVNLMQHKDGQVTDKAIPLDDILSGVYQPKEVDDDNDGVPDRWVNGDPVVGKFLEFRVHNYNGHDLSMDPAEYVAGKKTMIPIHRPNETELANALHRSFEFERQPTDEKPWVIETDGGKGFGMDPRRISAATTKNSGGLEVWRLINSGTWSHPIHIHFEEGVVLRRDGKEPPEWEKWARKDVYRLGPQPDSGDLVEVALRFREFAGTFMEHCHNTQHEDHAMLLRWDVEHPGQVKLMPTPIPTWDGVNYVDSVALPTFRKGDAVGQYGPAVDPVNIWVKSMVMSELDGIRDNPLRDALSDPKADNERGVATYPLTKGTNIDSEGNETEVWYLLHDVSDPDVAEELGLSWAGGLNGLPVAASAEASVSESGYWTFYGDLPNPVWSNTDLTPPLEPQRVGIPPVREDNTYSPLRRVNYRGKEVVFNAIILKWGDKDWEHNRIDESCTSFPDLPANTTCMYNGNSWGGLHESGHVVAMDTDGPNPYVSLKLHKSWSDGGDYLPYYIVLDTWPAGPARAMGVPSVPKHRFLAGAAVPLVQFVPGYKLRDSYPPMPANAAYAGQGDGFGISGGGPFGSQVGLPSYFMPEQHYSPMWHIGFAHWLVPAVDHGGVVKGIKQLKELRENGLLEILEFPAPPRINQGDATGIRVDDYDFNNLNSPHIVNCPTPMTIDTAIHRVRMIENGMKPH
jgi:FtsP/CotA-like multicopper oxidase with cupredoxin domain